MGSAVRLDGGTSVTILNLDERIAQLRVEQGTLERTRASLRRRDQIEIDTTESRVRDASPGNYRVDVDPTTTTRRSSRAQRLRRRVWRRRVVRDRGRAAVRVPGTQPRAARVSRRRRMRSTRGRRRTDRRYARSSAHATSRRDVIGYEDLDEYGTWRVVAEYGNVWIPRSVPADWAPYRYGHWAWIDPWGWTWVDDAPWGFAPFHYGRWARVRLVGAGCPGPVRFARSTRPRSSRSSAAATSAFRCRSARAAWLVPARPG